MAPGVDWVLSCAGSLCVVGGVGWSARTLLASDGQLLEQFRRYSGRLDRQLRFSFLPGSGYNIACGQLALLGLLALGGILLRAPACAALAAAVVASPWLYLARKRTLHVAKLDTQVDGLIVGLANGLKSVPSPSAALGQLVSVLPSPMRLEIDRLLSEIRLGNTLEQSLVNMSARLGSADIASALSAVLIGLQVGGNLPLVLENTAATIREMNRLEGVVRTKTSEGRAQLWVLALFPFFIAIGFNAIDPEYFVPLRAGALSTAITLVAGSFWAAALCVARRILKVDI